MTWILLEFKYLNCIAIQFDLINFLFFLKTKINRWWPQNQELIDACSNYDINPILDFWLFWIFWASCILLFEDALIFPVIKSSILAMSGISKRSWRAWARFLLQNGFFFFFMNSRWICVVPLCLIISTSCFSRISIFLNMYAMPKFVSWSIKAFKTTSFAIYSMYLSKNKERAIFWLATVMQIRTPHNR